MNKQELNPVVTVASNGNGTAGFFLFIERKFANERIIKRFS